MSDDVAVRVAHEATRVLDRDPAEHERQAVLEGVGVHADPDPELAHESEASASGSRSSESIVSAEAGAFWSRPQGPRLTCTATSPAASAGRTSLSTRSPTYASSPGAQLRELYQALEEARVRLPHAERGRGRDHVGRKRRLACPALQSLRLVSDDPDAQAESRTAARHGIASG